MTSAIEIINKARTSPIQATLARITPEIAEEMLQYNWHNREKQKDYIRMYELEMRKGQFSRSNTGIAFSMMRDPKDKQMKMTLVDGQNRLYSIIQAQQPIESYIMWGTRQSDCTGGRQRSINDVVKLEFTDTDSDIFGDRAQINARIISAVNFIQRYIDKSPVHLGKKISSYETKEFIKKYMKSILPVIEFANSHSKKITIAPVIAAMITANVKGIIPKAKLERFCYVLRTITTTDKNDFPAVGLKEWLQSREHFNQAVNLETYMRTCLALQACAKNSTARLPKLREDYPWAFDSSID